MRTIIAGSREKYWPADFDYIAEINQAVADSQFLITEVVSGTANGIDKKGIYWARGVGIPFKPFPANWNRDGKRAGYLRNEDMAEYAEAAIVVWDGRSPGSKHMIQIARRKRLKMYVHIPGVVTNGKSGIINLNSPTANMYGCEPCPRCKREYRCNFADSPNHITCDDCNYMELITTQENH